MTFQTPLRFKPTRRARTLVANAEQTPEPRIDRALIRAIVLARRWAEELAAPNSESLRAIARICPHYARQILPLAFLAPDLVEAIIDGRQPLALSLTGLIAQPLPPLWREQRALFVKFK